MYPAFSDKETAALCSVLDMAFRQLQRGPVQSLTPSTISQLRRSVLAQQLTTEQAGLLWGLCRSALKRQHPPLSSPLWQATLQLEACLKECGIVHNTAEEWLHDQHLRRLPVRA